MKEAKKTKKQLRKENLDKCYEAMIAAGDDMIYTLNHDDAKTTLEQAKLWKEVCETINDIEETEAKIRERNGKLLLGVGTFVCGAAFTYLGYKFNKMFMGLTYMDQFTNSLTDNKSVAVLQRNKDNLIKEIENFMKMKYEVKEIKGRR